MAVSPWQTDLNQKGLKTREPGGFRGGGGIMLHHLCLFDCSLRLAWKCNNAREALYLSECWMFYAVLTAGVIFTEKTSLRREQVWTFSVLGDRIYWIRYLFVAVGLNARFIVLPHWDNMSWAQMLPHPVTLY